MEARNRTHASLARRATNDRDDRIATPGRTTRTAGLSAEAAAERGTSGSAGALPYLDLIQRSFGRHDVRGIQAHTDDHAAAGANALGAEAFATSDHVAFAGTPSLHTAAHEAAHVVQQRAGVHLQGGLGQAGDVHEQHADAVADRVVAGRSAESLLDAYAPGTARAGIQRRLVIGGANVAAGGVAAGIQPVPLNPIRRTAAEQRMQAEAADNEDHVYTDWTTAAHGAVEIGADQIGSGTVTRGTAMFTNVAPRYRERAARVLELVVANPTIGAFIANRPCFITLINSPGNPASVRDRGSQIDINLAYWYFETYELGYILGMLCHEFAIHPMASQNAAVRDHEQQHAHQELPTGVQTGTMFGLTRGRPHTVNTDRSKQVDHIFGSLYGQPRHTMYRTAVLDMAEQLAVEASLPNAAVAPAEVTGLIDCFVMDCVSTLATDDDRSKGPQNSILMTQLYNHYMVNLRAAITNPTVRGLLPPDKSVAQIAAQYAIIVSRLAMGQLSASLDATTYQATALQLRYLERQQLALRWVEPDGRGGIGAIAFITRTPVSEVIANLLTQIQDGHTMLANAITRAGRTVADVVQALRTGNLGADQDDLFLELAAASQYEGVTVLREDGTTRDFLDGGRVLVRVSSPQLHYHASLRR